MFFKSKHHVYEEFIPWATRVSCLPQPLPLRFMLAPILAWPSLDGSLYFCWVHICTDHIVCAPFDSQGNQRLS